MSETESIEQKTCNQFIEKLKEGNCAGALELLVRKFPGGSGYAGEDLLLFITHNFSLDLVMFQALHYGCEGTFDEIKNKILEKSGYQEVFDDSNNIDGTNYSNYNQIKDAVHAKLRN